MRILLIEDNENDAIMVKRFLRDAQEPTMELEHVVNMEQALHRLAQESFDLILSDLGLPDSRGLETVSRIVANSKKIPLVVLTGTYQDGELANQSLEMGAQDYLVKDSLNSRWCRLAILHAVERKKLETMKEDFINNFSHELKTPLTIIRGIISNIGAGVVGEINPKLKDYLGRIDAGAIRLTQLVENILEVSKLASGKVSLHPTQVDLNGLIREAIRFFEMAAAKKQIALSMKVPKEPVYLSADEQKLKQVLTNLIDNALKFTSAGGSIEVSLTINSQETVFTVRDTGIGISKEYLQKIFDRFYRIEGKEHLVPGTGLGLSIVKDIIALHGGHITVESELNKGSCFKVVLPRQGGV